MGVLMSVYSVIMWNVLELREFARGESNRSLDVFLTKPTILDIFPELSYNEGKE